MQFLFFPAFYNYIYELSSGRDEKGWIKRGLKRNWWKIFVITLISYIPFYIMYAIGFAILMFFIFSNPSNYLLPTIIILGLICIFAIFWFAFFYIAQISVVAEERFQDGMKNIFKVGFKNYFKVLLASIITGVPAFAIGFFGGINAFYDNYKLSGFWATTNDLLNNPIVLVISLILALALGCVAISFMYVYTNKLYIAKRQELTEKQQEQTNAEQVLTPAE